MAAQILSLRPVHNGGRGSLLNADDVRFVDTPKFPAAIRDEALGQAAGLDYYRSTTAVTWTYLSSPPGNFSFEDFAVALVNEIETPQHLIMCFTVGY
jgi:uncharacterized protein